MATHPDLPIRDELVMPGTGASGRIEAGQTLRIIDVAGQQVADFCSFMASDPADYCDMTYTTFKAESWRVKLGDQLVSKRLAPMWTIVADDSNVHYAGGGFCSRELNRLLGIDQHGCRDTLEQQLSALGLDPLHLNPAACFNVFMNFPYNADGGIEVKVPNTKAGNRIDLRAESDMFWAASVCHMPGPCNGDNPTPMRFQVFDRPTART